MATPGIIDVETINGAMVAGAVSNSAHDIVDVTAEHTFKINTLAISNVDGTNDATISVSVSADNGSNYYHLEKTVTVPAD